MRKRQRASEPSRVGPENEQDHQHDLRRECQHRRPGKVTGESILRNTLALVIFVESYQSSASGKSVDGELQIVVQLDATIRDDVRIAKHDDPARPVSVVNQKTSFTIPNVYDWRGRRIKCGLVVVR